MQQQWDERYLRPGYFYGNEPNEFLRNQLTGIKPGVALFLGEGEGRNAVYCASLKWEVTAVDYSESAKIKALSLAAERGVNIIYLVSDISRFSFPADYFDLIALIFVHMPEEIRQKVHQLAACSLKKGGKLILEAFNPRQLNYSSGGPKDTQLLYTAESLSKDFAQLKIELCEETTTLLKEGSGHQGFAEVVRVVAQKL